MDTTTLQNHLIALRTRDGELDRRLAELDAKLGAWLAVVQAGQAALLELARKVVPGAATHGAGFTQKPSVAPAEPVARPEPTGKVLPEAPPRGDSPAQTSSDEELLQTLDAETARAIRVKRRLCHYSRSVQELLEEHQAAQGEDLQKGKPAERRGWWRRKDG